MLKGQFTYLKDQNNIDRYTYITADIYLFFDLLKGQRAL